MPTSREESEAVTVEELISAASRGDVNAACTILAAGDVEVNGTDPYGYTAVFKAATRGHTEVVRLLLEHGANPWVEVRGETALARAAEKGHHEVVEALLSSTTALGGRARPAMTRRGLLSWIHTAMCRACVGGHVKVVTALLDSPLIIDEEEQCKGEEAAQEDGGCIVDAAWFVSPLGQAAEEGHADVLHELLRKGKAAASIHLAGVGGEAALVRSCRCVTCLLDHGAVPDVHAMMAAANVGTLDVLEALLSRGGDACGRDEGSGVTVLANAARWGRLDAVRLLMEHGADPEVRDRQGQRPVDVATDERVREALGGGGA